MATIMQRVDRINEEIRGVEGQSITKWERNFLDDIRGRAVLSDKQEKTLIGIEAKVFETRTRMTAPRAGCSAPMTASTGGGDDRQIGRAHV